MCVCLCVGQGDTCAGALTNATAEGARGADCGQRNTHLKLIIFSENSKCYGKDAFDNIALIGSARDKISPPEPLHAVSGALLHTHRSHTTRAHALTPHSHKRLSSLTSISMAITELFDSETANPPPAHAVAPVSLANVPREQAATGGGSYVIKSGLL